MTPETAVTRLAKIVVPRKQFSEDEVYEAMRVAGIPDSISDRTYKFVQLAWGRELLANLHIEFSPLYVYFNALGDVFESGKLQDEPHFAAAAAVASKYVKSAGFQRLALMSAEVQAINSALSNGSKAADIAVQPAFLFLDPPTEAGLEKAKSVMARYAATLPHAKPNKKPWWQFW